MPVFQSSLQPQRTPALGAEWRSVSDHNRILVMVVQSDPIALEKTLRLVQSEGYETVVAEDDSSSLRQFFNSHPEIVLVDVSDDGAVGWDAVVQLRRIGDTPIIVIADEAPAEFITKGAELGVAGFVVRPFESNGLIVRLNAVRDNLVAQDGDRRWLYQKGRLMIDWRSCDVFVEGKPVALTGTEYRLLAYFVKNRGWVLTHDQILNNVWGTDYGPDRRQVKLYIWYLRQKLEMDPKKPEIIRTKRGLGYTFVG